MVDERRKVAFVDIDGTLVDTQERYNMCLQEVGAKSLDELRGERRSAFWNCFQSEKYMNLDKPNWRVINYVNDLKRLGFKIKVLSGRMESQREATIDQLARYGVQYDELILRKDKDFRKDYEYKGEIILNHVRQGWEVIVIDDSKAVRDVYPEGSYDPNNLPDPLSLYASEL